MADVILDIPELSPDSLSDPLVMMRLQQKLFRALRDQMKMEHIEVSVPTDDLTGAKGQ